MLADPCSNAACDSPGTCETATNATCKRQVDTPKCTYPLAPAGTTCGSSLLERCSASGSCDTATRELSILLFSRLSCVLSCA